MIINLYFVFHPNHLSEAILIVLFVKFPILKLPFLKMLKIILKIFARKKAIYVYADLPLGNDTLRQTCKNIDLAQQDERVKRQIHLFHFSRCLG